MTSSPGMSDECGAREPRVLASCNRRQPLRNRVEASSTVRFPRRRERLSSMPPPVLVAFVAGTSGTWHVDRMATVVGTDLPPAERLAMLEGAQMPAPDDATWILRGVTSNTRYTNRSELDGLAARQEGLSRPHATRAALIPIRKTDAWWALAQDERRAIFEERSRHIGIGQDYLPAIARRLHHG